MLLECMCVCIAHTYMTYIHKTAYKGRPLKGQLEEMNELLLCTAHGNLPFSFTNGRIGT